MIKTVGELELISPLIGKARALSNFRLERESFGLRLVSGFGAFDLPARIVNKIVRFVRGAARRAR